MKQKYRVIIIGAGPSGLSTAINLYKRGIKDILVIEKYKFPRYKCCAGYITNKTKKVYESFGLDIKKCHYSLIDNFKICYNLKEKQAIKNKFLYTNENIDRVELDNEFYKLAKKQGITILEETKVKESDLTTNSIIVTGNKRIYYDYLVFADGTNGYGSIYQKAKHKNIAMQKIFKSDRKDGIEIHFNITKKGYGWASTYKGITNVGLTDLYNKNINYNAVFSKFLKDLDLDNDTTDVRGAFTPYGIGIPIINNNIYFVGDAVGACDPLTLSGLRYGLKSGELCAEAIRLENPKIYRRYIKNLKVKFNLMKLLMSIFYLKGILFLIFNVGCRYFGKLISLTFNNFFINKK